MKICILSDGIPPAGKGGAERIAWDSALMLKKTGHDVSVITTAHSSSPTPLISEVNGIKVFSISSNYHVRWRAWVSLRNTQVIKELRKILSDVKPDIVHAHNIHLHLSYASLKVAHESGAKVFHTIHDAMPFNYDKLTTYPKYKISPWQQMREQQLRYNPFRNFFIRQSFKNVQTLFTVSHALANALRQNGIREVQVLYNGIDSSVWKISDEVIKAFKEQQKIENRKILLFGGRITGTKGGTALLSALPKIVQEIPDAMLLIMGTENEYVRSLVTKAKEMRIEKHIRVTGWLTGDGLRAAYHAADVVVVPSLYLDPLPTVVLEAMACAKPVVGSCFGGIPEMVIDEETGYVVDPNITDAIAEKCIALLKDRNLAADYGRAGAGRQEKVFSQTKHLSELLKAYNCYTYPHERIS
jgi:glycosyltransferase involved in cell wall biosynthesis